MWASASLCTSTRRARSATASTPAHSTEFSVDAPSMFMCFTSLVLPIDPGGGRHVYSFRLAGQQEQVDVPLAVRVSRS